MELLVQKPQFDTSTLKPGKAVRVEDISYRQSSRKYSYNSKFKDLKTDAFIVEVAPLEILVYYLDMETKQPSKLIIPVDLVADKLIEIKLMEVAQ